MKTFGGIPFIAADIFKDKRLARPLLKRALRCLGSYSRALFAAHSAASYLDRDERNTSNCSATILTS